MTPRNASDPPTVHHHRDGSGHPQRITPIGSTRMATLATDPPRVTADPHEWDLDPGTTVAVAKLYLTRLTPAQLRAHVAAGRCEPEYRPMFAGIADAMDALLAEGFDPAVFAEEIRATAPAAA